MTSQIDHDRRRAPTGNGRSRSEEPSRRASQWVAIVYVAVALATPLLVYAGPDVMSPAAPAIAEAALDGQLTMNPMVAHAIHAGGVDIR